MAALDGLQADAGFGIGISFDIFLGFAARRNSSRAPHGPRSRRRSSLSSPAAVLTAGPFGDPSCQIHATSSEPVWLVACRRAHLWWHGNSSVLGAKRTFAGSPVSAEPAASDPLLSFASERLLRCNIV